MIGKLYKALTTFYNKGKNVCLIKGVRPWFWHRQFSKSITEQAIGNCAAGGMRQSIIRGNLLQVSCFFRNCEEITFEQFLTLAGRLGAVGK